MHMQESSNIFKVHSALYEVELRKVVYVCLEKNQDLRRARLADTIAIP